MATMQGQLGMLHFTFLVGVSEGSLEVKLPTRWPQKKVRRESQSKETVKEEKVRENQKKEDAGARKGRKVANIVFFQRFVAPAGRKVGSLERRVRSQFAK